MNGKLMVVEDEEEIRSMMVRVLRSKGYEVLEVSGFHEALTLMGRERVDMVISDISMPDGSGVELGKAVKKRWPETGVALMTGRHSEKQVIEAIRSGADFYLKKPLTEDDLLETVQNMAELRSETARIGIHEARPGWYEFVITSSEDAIAKLQSFLDALLKDILNEERFWDVKFSISELGRNAVEWGNRFDIESVVKLSIGITDSAVTIKIEDEGDGFDVKGTLETIEEMPCPDQQEKRMAESKRPGGLGIRVIRETADRIIFNEKGNMVVLQFRVGE
ncbi:MAG: response regulator [Deltaproteobacteria bacterium]|nr:response regulator [Deltaproteobacteria bacterium]MBW2152139.1 response regulator [Deltaproteobacteria bacterium]